jgi:hypothetical protein
MDVSQALEQLNEIHHHLGRSEIYRGYRSKTLGLMGLVGFAGAAFLQFGWSQAANLERVGFWVAVAALNLAIAAWEILGDYGDLRSDHQRRTTKRTVGQFLPTLCGGTLLTMVFVSKDANLELLPGIWSLMFSLGIFASRPYLPRGVGWVGAFFLAAGALLLGFSESALVQPWYVGGVFGVGQLLLAYVMYQNLEREKI